MFVTSSVQMMVLPLVQALGIAALTDGVLERPHRGEPLREYESVGHIFATGPIIQGELFDGVHSH